MRSRPALRASVLATTLVTLMVMLGAGPVQASAGVRHANASVRRAARGGPGVWTKVAKVDNGFDYPGLLRTGDGKLHVLWRKQLPNGHFAYGYTTIALNGVIGATGTALSDWVTLDEDPVLIANGNGIRALFKGGIDTGGGFFSRGSIYTLTSTIAGTTWQLPQQTVMQQRDGLGDLGGTAEADHTPVAVSPFNNTLYYHEGLDSSSPAAAPDGTASLSSGDYEHPSAVTASDDSVWVAYFRIFSSPPGLNGYYVQQVLPNKDQPIKAPDSTPKSGGNNDPNQAVAMVARGRGGVYLAYCVPGPNGGFTVPCAHVDLWKVGSPTPMVVPGTGSGTITHVALAAGLAGRISVVTEDAAKQTINAVRTNMTATKFGPVRTIKLPPGQVLFNRLEAEGTFGRLDIVVDLQASASPNPIFLWHTQILSGLTLTASPQTFSHTAAHTVTFIVKDAGDPVPGAKVTCLGKSATTNGQGEAKITFPKGTKTGQHVATASDSDYNPGKVTIKVT
ncbi:MAG TPA: hypothetical protein VNN79_17925 [Actinomycetota bacterium]|nr:hypothetical protein [Actinomycetota bacterium]